MRVTVPSIHHTRGKTSFCDFVTDQSCFFAKLISLGLDEVANEIVKFYSSFLGRLFSVTISLSQDQRYFSQP